MKKKKPQTLGGNEVSLCGFGARDWIRTSTSLRTLRPEHSASTNFATRALLICVSGAANVANFWEFGISNWIVVNYSVPIQSSLRHLCGRNSYGIMRK